MNSITLDWEVPLAKRYNAGERSISLYDAMMEVR